MTKQILPNELAEIVTGLLIKPELLGELDSREAHQAFMLDIGRVIADALLRVKLLSGYC
ncbi:TPA: hypothetical protein ACXNK4_005408 [Klebsiella pneumoniae]